MYNTLSIINKGLLEKKQKITLNYNNKNLLLVKIFYNNGYVFNYNISYNKIEVMFNIFNNKLIFNNLKFYKSLNVRKYITYKQLKRLVFLKNKKLILDTSFGILDSGLALKYRIGGCILFEFI